MKKFLLIAACAVASLTASAQITEATPRADVLPTGNRLEKGVWGLFVGAGMTFDKHNDQFTDDKFNVSPLVNVKYMFTDKIEGRIGAEFGKIKENVKFETGGEGSLDRNEKTVLSHNYFNPGVAYHFSKNNLLDVYMGGELPFGWERNTTKSITGDDYDNEYGKQFNIGLGAFVGLQAFIGRLPLSIGLEYGIQSMFTAGNGMTKYVSKAGDADEQVSYDYGIFSGEKMKARRGEILSQARITLSYYFK